MTGMDVKRHLFASRKRTIILGVIAALLLIGATFAAVRIISNILTLGPTQHVVEAIELNTVKNLPPSLKTGEEGEAEFSIRNTGSALTNISLKARIKANGQSLSDPAIATLEFRDPETGDKQFLALTSINGNLEATPKSGWNVPLGFQQNAKLWITLKPSAPAAAFSIELWAEADDGGTPPPPSTRSFTLDAASAGFVGVSGTNADGTSIAGLANPVLKVKAGETVSVTIVRKDSIHNFAVYTAACPDGFCANPIVRSADVTAGSPQTTTTFTAPASGPLFYHCDYHASTMLGTVEVIP